MTFCHSHAFRRPEAEGLAFRLLVASLGSVTPPKLTTALIQYSVSLHLSPKGYPYLLPQY